MTSTSRSRVTELRWDNHGSWIMVVSLLSYPAGNRTVLRPPSWWQDPDCHLQREARNWLCGELPSSNINYFKKKLNFQLKILIEAPTSDLFLFSFQGYQGFSQELSTNIWLFIIIFQAEVTYSWSHLLMTLYWNIFILQKKSYSLVFMIKFTWALAVRLTVYPGGKLAPSYCQTVTFSCFQD